MNKKHILLSLLFVFAFSSGCKIRYSFTGASIPASVETVSIQYFPNRAPLANPTLSQQFTEALKNIFLQQTNLNLVQQYGDLQFEGEITGYKVSPVAITGNETAALNRLTITVKVRFTNTQDETQSFESSFSRFADFESSKNLSDVEDALITEINNQLTQDIFSKAVSNW